MHDLLPIERDLVKLDHFGEFYVFILDIDELSLTMLVDREAYELLDTEPQGERLVTHVDLA